MASRRSKDKVSEDALGSIFTCGLIYALFRFGYRNALAIFVLVMVLLVVIGVSIRVWRRRQRAQATFEVIDKMSGVEFEKFLVVLFERQGYRVRTTRTFGDFGGDLVLNKDGVTTIVQAKRWTGSVGIKAVQEAVAAKAVYSATEAMVVTNSHLTNAAEELARVNHVTVEPRASWTSTRNRGADLSGKFTRITPSHNQHDHAGVCLKSQSRWTSHPAIFPHRNGEEVRTGPDNCETTCLTIRLLLYLSNGV